MGTGSFPGVKSGRGVTLTPQSLLVPWSWKSRAISLLPLWAIRPVQSLSACTRVHFTFTFGHERVELYLYSPYGPYGLYRASLPVQGVHFTFTFGHERVELYLSSPYGPYALYRASVLVQGCTLPLPLVMKE